MPMRTQSRLRFIRVIAVASLLACAGSDALAQGAVKETPVAGQNAEPSPPYDLEIKDGTLTSPWAERPRSVPATLENVVDLLRKIYPEENFVLSSGLGSTVIADLKMRNSSVEDKLEAIRIAGGSQFVWHPVHPFAIDPQTGLPARKNLYVLDALPATAKPGLQVEAFNISTYLTSFNSLSGKGTEEERQKRMAQIEQMVRETVEEYSEISRRAANKSNAKSLQVPSIRFHPGANLAVIIGEPETVAVAAKVIGALPGAQRSTASNARENDDSYRQSLKDELIKRLQRDVTPGGLPAPNP